MAKTVWVGRSDRNFILFWNFISSHLPLKTESIPTCFNGLLHAFPIGNKSFWPHKSWQITVFLKTSHRVRNLWTDRSFYQWKDWVNMRCFVSRSRRRPCWRTGPHQKRLPVGIYPNNFFILSKSIKFRWVSGKFFTRSGYRKQTLFLGGPRQMQICKQTSFETETWWAFC